MTLNTAQKQILQTISIFLLGIIVGIVITKILTPAAPVQQPPVVERQQPQSPMAPPMPAAEPEALTKLIGIDKLPLNYGHPMTMPGFEGQDEQALKDAEEYYWGAAGAKDKGSLKWADYKSRYRLVVFGSAMCPYCALLQDYLLTLKDNYGDKLDIIVINDAPDSIEEAREVIKMLKEREPDAKAVLAKYKGKIDYTVGKRADLASFATMHRIAAVPQMFLIDVKDDNKILFRSKNDDLGNIFSNVETPEKSKENDKLLKLLKEKL